MGRKELCFTVTRTFHPQMSKWSYKWPFNLLTAFWKGLLGGEWAQREVKQLDKQPCGESVAEKTTLVINKFDCLWELPGFCPEDLAHLNPRPGHSNIVERMLGEEMGTWDKNDDGKFMAMIRAEIYWFFFFFTVFQDIRASLIAQLAKNLPAMQETSVRLGIGYPLQYSWASLMAQLVKNPPAMQETWVLSPHQEDHLEKGMATHCSILAWRIPRTEEPDELQSIGAQNQTGLSD